MIDTIYIERDVADHPRAAAILERFPRASRVPVERYGEVFNRRSQSFRLQKRKPALILARKHGNPVLETPSGYGIGSPHNFYFSHMLNCIYDCRYCFLQGMFQSAHRVLFVNYEDFEAAIRTRVEELAGEEATFFSGYDCDSLAFESVTGFVEHFLPVFGDVPGVFFELRTKSAAVRSLLDAPVVPGVVVAFSLSPAPVAAAHEHGAPRLEARLAALRRLAEKGWRLGLRFDPILDYAGAEADYEALFEQTLEAVPGDVVHSISLGLLRFPKAMFETIRREYPDEPLLAAGLEPREEGRVSYGREREAHIVGRYAARIRELAPGVPLFSPEGFGRLEEGKEPA